MKLGELAATERNAYRASVTETELANALADRVKDWRRVSVNRIFTVDLPRAVQRFCRGFTKDDRQTLRTNALLLIARRSGLWRGIDCGAEGEMPLRSDWLIDGSMPSVAAWHVLQAALKQAAQSADVSAPDVEPIEIPTDGTTLADVLTRNEREERRAEDGAPVPELRAEMLAEAMGLPLRAARAILYRAYNLNPDDAAALWHVKRTSVATIVSEGARELEARYPEATDLIVMLRDVRRAARDVESELAQNVRDAVVDGDAQLAAQWAIEWRSVARMMSADRRALLAATRLHCETESQARLSASAVPMLLSGARAEEKALAARIVARALRGSSRIAPRSTRLASDRCGTGYTSLATLARRTSNDWRPTSVREMRADLIRRGFIDPDPLRERDANARVLCG